MNRFIIMVSLLPLLVSCKPNPEKILKKAFDKCQSIENGYYEMYYSKKFMSGNDTSTENYKCNFRRLADDTIYYYAFKNEHINKKTGKNGFTYLYTGSELVHFPGMDNSAEIMPVALFADVLKKPNYRPPFYEPFLSVKRIPLPNDSDIFDRKNKIIYIGEEKVNEFTCYHIKFLYEPEEIYLGNMKTNMMKMICNQVELWINKKDFIPVQYTIRYDFVMANDTMSQFEKYVLKEYILNNLINDTLFTLSQIPSGLKLKNKELKEHKHRPLLENGTLAKEWTLLSPEGKPVSLSDFKGKLLLIDFFYKGCYPCMLALPVMERLHKKYRNKGLNVIGIDPHDTKEDGIVNFLAKRGVTYPVLLGGDATAKEYNVSGYPTFYLIGKDGKIIYSFSGYGEALEADLEKIIEKNL